MSTTSLPAVIGVGRAVQLRPRPVATPGRRAEGAGRVYGACADVRRAVPNRYHTRAAGRKAGLSLGSRRQDLQRNATPGLAPVASGDPKWKAPSSASLKAIPCSASQESRQSKKASGSGLVNGRVHRLPPSVVLQMRDCSPRPMLRR